MGSLYRKINRPETRFERKQYFILNGYPLNDHYNSS